MRPVLCRLAVVLCLAVPALATTVATRDGLALTFDERGAVTDLAVDGRSLAATGAAGGLFTADVAGIPTREPELLGNPGFERLRDGKPEGWSVAADWAPDTTVAHSGGSSMKVTVPGPEKRPSGELAIDVPVQPNTPYRVTLWLRTQGCAPSFYVVQLDAAGKTHPDYPQLCISHARRNADWFPLTTTVTTGFFCRQLRVYTRIWQETGTAWVDDASVVCLADDYLTPQQPATGTAKPVADGVALAAEPAGLSLTASCRSTGDYLTLDGQVADTTGQDRAVTLSWRLPLRAEGGTWFEDLRNQVAIEPGVTHGSARLVGERRLMSLLPFAALGNGRDAVALAVPMDQPVNFRLGYQSGVGYFVQYELGLTRAATKSPGRAGFRCYLYRVDPAWGFRSAAERYYRFFPQFFTKRVTREGGAGFMADEATFEGPLYRPPAFAIYNWQRRDAAEAYRRQGSRLFPYTEFIGWWGWALGIKAAEAATQPTPAEAWARVERMAHADPPDDVARCILNCVPYDREGKPRLHSDYVPEWGGYNYLCNPDPEIEGLGGRVNRFTLTQKREVSLVDGVQADGMYFDCAFVFVTDNFRREHFAWADVPLTFDHLSKRPVLPMASSVFECAKALSDDMHGRGKLVMSNYSVTQEPTDLFCIPFIDVIGNEMLWTWCTHAKLALQRTLAHQKTVSMSWQEAKNDWAPERVERELKQAMFYGTFYYLSGLKPEVEARWLPLTRRLAAAGWEPVTRARSNNPAVLVERFGDGSRDNLHLTLRNDGDQPATATLTLDAVGLGLVGKAGVEPWLMADSSTPQRAAARHEANTWAVDVTVPAGDTLVLRLADPRGLAADQAGEVPDLLAKAGRYAAALRAAGAAVTAPDYAALTERARAADVLMPGKLAALRAALTDPVVTGATGKAEAWRTFLLEYHSQAGAALAKAAQWPGAGA